MSNKPLLVLAAWCVFVLAACGSPAPTQVSGEKGTPPSAAGDLSGALVIYSGRSEALLQPVIDTFKAKYPHIDVLLKSGNNSELANALLEEQANPQADVFITTELITVQSLADKGIFEAYRPAAADRIPSEFIHPQGMWVGLTRRVRVIMYNTDLVSEVEAPKSIFDLTDPKWRGQIAAAGSTNGSMQAQVAAMRQLLGEQATQSWLEGLVGNDVTFFGGHTDVRKAVGAGEFKIGLVNHYYYYLQEAEGSPVGIVFPDQGPAQIGLITNATAVGIIKGTEDRAIPEAFVNFLLSDEGQKLFAEANFEYPLVSGVALHPNVQPLDAFRIADVNVSQAAQDIDATFDLIERVGLP